MNNRMNKTGVWIVLLSKLEQCLNPLGAVAITLARRFRDTFHAILFDSIHNYLIILQIRILL